MVSRVVFFLTYRMSPPLTVPLCSFSCLQHSRAAMTFLDGPSTININPGAKQSNYEIIGSTNNMKNLKLHHLTNGYTLRIIPLDRTQSKIYFVPFHSGLKLLVTKTFMTRSSSNQPASYQTQNFLQLLAICLTVIFVFKITEQLETNSEVRLFCNPCDRNVRISWFWPNGT